MKRAWLGIGLTLLAALGAGLPASARQPASPQGGPAALVKDINTGTDPFGGIHSIVPVGDTIFLAANDSAHGLELWKSDGTEAGTVMIKDVHPSGDGIAPNSPLVPSGGVIYFRGNDGVHGVELWRSDGTAAGTVMVKDINPGAGDGLFQLQPFEDALILVASDGVTGAELWRSDGTPAGTALIRDIRPGSETDWLTQPNWFAAADGWMYFSADDSHAGRELWRTDGFSATTTLVRDIRPGAEGSDPEQLLYVEGTLHFAAADGSQTYSKSIWTTDGTAAGTREGETVQVGSAGDQTIRMHNVGGKLYYVTSGLTRFTCEIHGPALDRAFGTCPANLTQAYGRVFFISGDWLSNDYNQLWQTDGSDAGTSIFREQAADTSMDWLTEAAGWLFFTADDGQHGQELWQSAGTPGGTAMIQDINPGAGDSYPHRFTLAGDRLYFVADDGAHGSELWSLPLGPRWANRLFAPLLGR